LTKRVKIPRWRTIRGCSRRKALYGDLGPEPAADELAAHRKHMQLQTEGMEKLEGSYPFTVEVSVRAFRVNEFIHGLVQPENRRAFLEDPESAFSIPATIPCVCPMEPYTN
jgi:gallate dioxygenase